MEWGKNEPGALILAGGQSRRMGTDKALIRLQPGGPRLIERVLAAVQPLVGQVVVSANRPADYAWLGLPLAPDNYPGLGPLAGLEAGLGLSTARYNLVVACDMPFVRTAALALLLEQVTEDVQAVVPLNPAGRPEPLCAVYSQACRPHIRRLLLAGSLKMTGLLETIPTRYVPAGAFAHLDPEWRTFTNLNTPETVNDLRFMIYD